MIETMFRPENLMWVVAALGIIVFVLIPAVETRDMRKRNSKNHSSNS